MKERIIVYAGVILVMGLQAVCVVAAVYIILHFTQKYW
jgi:hypothetical protein